jgi:hypothetical protein
MGYKFPKKHIPWNKGKKGLISEEGLQRIREGYERFLQEKGHPMLGKKHSDATRKKMRLAKLKNPTRYWLGKKRPKIAKLPQIFKKGYQGNKGKPALWATGERNRNWRGGVTPEHEKFRKSLEYKEWRNAVLKRDKWKCVKCGVVQSRKVKMIVDHIKPFTLFPELRLVVNNGRTFCKPCDDKYGFKWNRHLSWEENLTQYQLMNSNKSLQSTTS